MAPSYRAGVCHIENTRLSAANATIGWVKIRARRYVQAGLSNGRISQLGVPEIKSGGAASVSRT